MENTRVAEVFKDGKWVRIPFSEIKSGNLVRLFEDTGEPVLDNHGNSTFIAKTDTHLNQFGIWEFEVIDNE